MADAIARTLFRLFVSRRHLLDWVTAAQATVSPRLDLARVLSADERRRRHRHRCRDRRLVGRERRLAGGGAVRARLDRRAGDRALDEPVAARRRPPAGLGCGRPRAAPGRAPHLALLRDLRHGDGPHAAAGQLPGRPEAGRRAPHLAHQPRPLPALRGQRPRLRLDRDDRDRRAAGSDARDDGRPAALPRPLLQLVRHARPAPARPALRLVGGQRQSRRAPDRARQCLPGVDRPPAGGRRAVLPASTTPCDLTREALQATSRRPADADDHAAASSTTRSTRWPPRCARRRVAARRTSRHDSRTLAPHAATLADIARTLASERGDDAGADMLFWAEATQRVDREPPPRRRADRRRRARPGTAPGDARGDGARPWPTRWSSASCSTRTASCSRSAIGSPRARSTRAATTCSPPRRASRASSRSPRATSRRGTGSGSGAPVTPVGRGAALISWSGSMFEYLMPSLVMRAPAGSLLEQTSRLVVRRQIELRRRARRALGHLGVRLQRPRPGAHLSVLELRRPGPRPEARPERERRRRALRDGARGDGRSRARRRATSRGSPPSARAAATASTRRSTTRRTRLPEGKDVAIVRAFMAHHQGMTVVAIANALLDGAMRGALPRRADRAGDGAAAAGAHAARRRGRSSAGGGSQRRRRRFATWSCRRCGGCTPRTAPRRRRTCSRTAATR